VQIGKPKVKDADYRELIDSCFISIGEALDEYKGDIYYEGEPSKLNLQG
jgi:hypothetical protein